VRDTELSLFGCRRNGPKKPLADVFGHVVEHLPVVVEVVVAEQLLIALRDVFLPAKQGVDCLGAQCIEGPHEVSPFEETAEAVWQWELLGGGLPLQPTDHPSDIQIDQHIASDDAHVFVLEVVDVECVRTDKSCHCARDESVRHRPAALASGRSSFHVGDRIKAFKQLRKSTAAYALHHAANSVKMILHWKLICDALNRRRRVDHLGVMPDAVEVL
jgi:hypothetical protein